MRYKYLSLILLSMIVGSAAPALAQTVQKPASSIYTANSNFRAQGLRLDQYYTDPNGNTLYLPDAIRFDNTNNTDYITLGDETASFGGMNNPNGPVVHKSISVSGLPYGPYNLGCVECIFSSKSSYGGGGAQAALSGIDYRNGSWAINNGDMATAMTYRAFTNEHTRFTAAVSYFDQRTIYLKTPMSTAELAQLHPGMYLTTNNLDPTCTVATDSSGVYNDCRLKGIIASWTTTSITTYGFGRVGGGNSVGNPTPHPTQAEMTAGTDISTYLDTTYETLPIPLVYVGSGGKDFAGNDYMTIDANHAYSTRTDTTTTADAASGATDIIVASTDGLSNGQYVTGTGIPSMTTILSINGNTKDVTLSAPLTSALASGSTVSFYSPLSNGTNMYEMIERDTRIYNATPQHPISFHGTTESFECDNCQSGGINNDSYMYLVNGPGLARAYVAQMPSDSLEYSGYNSYIPSNGAPVTKSDNRVAFAFRKALSTNNTLALVGRVVKDVDASSYWNDWSYRLGMIVDPKLSNAVQTNGANMGEIAWNFGGSIGSLCLIYNETMNFCSANNKVTSYAPIEFLSTASADTVLRVGQYSTMSSALIKNGSNNNYQDTDATIQGQGTIQTWNDVCGACATTEFINVNPSTAYAGGFNFYAGTLGDKLSSLNHIMSLGIFGVDIYHTLNLHGNGIFVGELTASTTTKTLSTIKGEPHAESDKTWCHDCRSPSQAAGAGTGRWIYLDSGNTWRTEDGLEASN